MPSSCAAYNCLNRYSKDSGLSFHKFPQDPEIKQQWIMATKRRIYCPSEHTKLCSNHFKPEDFETGLRKKLKKNAIPTLFQLPLRVKMIQRVKRQVTQTSEVRFKPEMFKEGEQKEDEPPKKMRKNSQENEVIIKSEVIPCCALACTNTSETHVMNCLPRDGKMREVWINKIDRLEWVPDDDSALCEIHFPAEMWLEEAGDEKILREDAEPSLYLHGEAIKSWVTCDNFMVENFVVESMNNNEATQDNSTAEKTPVEENSTEENPENDIIEVHESDVDEDSFYQCKREALEPEIDMVEGSEDVVAADRQTEVSHSREDQFELVYCDDTSDLVEGMDPDNPLDPDSTITLERASSPVIQDEEVSCIDDSLDHLESKGSKEKASEADFLMMSKPSHIFKKMVRRRNSSQLSDDFKCPICERRLSRKKNLEVHMEKLHPNGELSEHQKRKLHYEAEERNKLQQKSLKEQLKIKPKPPVRKPPPPLTPLVPNCLFTHPPNMPTVPLLGTLVPPTLIAPPTLVTTSSLIPSPSKDPSPSGGEVKKQFLLLLQNQPTLPASVTIPQPPSITPPIHLASPPPPPPPEPPKGLCSIDLNLVPEEKRSVLKQKMMEMVDAVVKKDLDPANIIIAYGRTS